MQSANLSGPLKGLRPYQALLGPTQASGLAGGFDSVGKELFGVLDGLGLPDEVDLDLAGVLHLVLDLLGDVPG